VYDELILGSHGVHEKERKVVQVEAISFHFSFKREFEGVEEEGEARAESAYSRHNEFPQAE